MAIIKLLIQETGQTSFQKTLELEAGVRQTIGRESKWLMTHSKSASRIHCSITLEGSKVLLRDLKSSHGTWVNNKKIEQSEIHIGDILKIGDCIIEIQDIENLTSSYKIEFEQPKQFSPAPVVQQTTSPPKIKVTQHYTAPVNSYFNLEFLLSSPNELVNFYKSAFTKPKEFFENLELEGSLLNSLIIGACCMTALTVIVSRFAISNGFILIFIPIIFALQSLTSAVFLSIVGPFVGLNGTLSKYVRFHAFVTLFSLPASVLFLIPNLDKSIAQLPMIVTGLLATYGFVKTFKPNIFKMAVMTTALFAIGFFFALKTKQTKESTIHNREPASLPGQ